MNKLMVFILLLLLLFGSCKKYEDNTGISLKTATGRLIGSWKVVRTDGIDFDSLFLADYNIHIDHTINITRSSFIERLVYTDLNLDSGNVDDNTIFDSQWQWGKNKDTLILLDSRPNTYIPITKLTNSEFNYQYLDGTFTNTLLGFSGITSYECIKL
jgi:hypothetical protein